ncbi:hypothetical protein EJ05DRAFT_331582 [Pseudovirgaria hyperparasitica]|uniref:Mitochondrial protein from FMP27-domain-containing protein n=1 Tax=Pseudovirgaria hyperparasitica TaxID=470096 RepID=A0A6A6W850_9PEZI|nr:uncharacterized protein EJ05DRAFT_331582 [Pseudovirgaria hyperparasitica]KAF2759068.1 hypothetical protein EJ05DRAFT_331582 [Pseudovirgaria hyperparasitica]
MAVPSVSFVAGLLVLAYLGSFVLFAFIRVTTGVSIQRIGYTGLRRIAYVPRDGIKIELRGLGLNLHRPTFAQPTWLSVVLTELKITIDLKQLGSKPPKRPGWVHWPNSSTDKLGETSTPISSDFDDDGTGHIETPRSRTWERLTETKEKIKRLHRKIQWIKLVDLVTTSSALVVVDVGSVQVSHFTMAVDTRRKTVDRSRLFQHRKTKTDERRPAEWIFTVRSILLNPEGGESAEILDHCTLNVHGFLYKELDGLRDASIALKLGRLNIPSDEIQTAVERSKRCRSLHHRRRGTNASESDISFSDVIEELDQPGSREENIVRTVSDSKEFVASILRGIQEIQFAVSYLGLTKRIRSANATETPVWLNVSMKEVGLDLVRLDQKSPAHLQYFSRNDVAHQALLAAIAVSVGIDDGREDHERLLYIPMATATVKTTLPSKTIQYQREKNVAERNANILYANLVATSPSLDLDPKHLPLVLDLLQGREKSSVIRPSRQTKRHLISKLLPKASIKVSVHEPVVRVTLPPMEKEKQGTDEFDLLISAMSNISLDVESSHSAGGELHYSLASDFRVQSHQLYYQTASSEKHNLLLTESLEIKVQVSASPEVAVIASGDLQTFSIYMVRPEIAEGIRQIVVQLRSETSPMRRYHTHMSSKVSFLRRLPSWLQHFSLTGSDFSAEVAGIDPQVSDTPKGVAVHLDSWNAEYKANREEQPERQHTRRRAASRTFQREDYLKPSTPPASPMRKLTNASDGRRLAFHVQGLEGFVVESADTWEPEPFLGLPRFEVAFSTSSDNSGPIFHVNTFAKSLFFHYSMYRHFCIGVATLVLRKAFKPPIKTPTQTRSGRSLGVPDIEVDELGELSSGKPELTTIDIKAAFVQIKATMPNDPLLMIQIQDLESGRHRWAPPFFRARLTRLYADTPRMPGVWSRVVSIKGARVDLRKSRHKPSGGHTVEERSIDVATDAVRLAVPHQLVIHKIFDNFANLTKTVQQLHHRFHTGTDEYILDKEPEKPKNVPKISFRSQAVLFEIEDGSFEWKLGVIYRLGLLEQKQRLAREEAFRLKVKKLEELNKTRGSTSHKVRAKSTHEGRSRIKKKRTSAKGRSKSEHVSDEDTLSPNRKTREMRYDMEGKANVSASTQMDIEEARERLQKLNAQTWKKRIDHGLDTQSRTMKDIRSIFWGLDEMPDDDTQQKEVIMAIPQRPALMGMLVSDFSLVIDKPSFPVSQYSTFLHRIGKGMPFDQKYSLLIPMNVQVNMGEVRVTLRDYPLPLLHVPAIRSGQSPRLPSLSLRTDFVIGEEFQDHESMRYVHVVVVPAQTDDTGKAAKGFSVRVPRTVSPVKTYSDMSVDVNTSYPTRFTWGTSYQPAIQDMMQVIESFTKPAIDPSERVGFWDKIRLTFHSRINVHWKGDGDVHLILKGSRDPYMVTGHGAGFVMCWRNDVRWSLCRHDDPKKFMTVDSGNYVLAIPDLGHYARILADPEISDADSVHSGLSNRHQASFKKTIMKLSGRVQWLAGLVFERNLERASNRSFEFIPHYKVVLKNPEFAKCANNKVYDAFRGFRSNHIHLSIAVSAPHDRDWSVANLKPSSNYNSVHLTPRFFSHFFNWWSMFSGAMSLPIRQGKLWPGVEKSSKKFGRHLATIKYNLLLSPLFMSHIYKHKDNEGTDNGAISATGLKVRLDSFMLDLHQRREEFKTLVQGPKASGNDKSNQTTGMRINEAQLDFIAADIRAISALVNAPNSNDLDEATDEMLASYQTDGATSPVDLSNFTIPDKDLKWIDMDDFVELDWVLPTEAVPQTQILPLAFAPRFTYFRQTDHQGHISGDPSRHSHFGKEPTHFCVMSARNDPRRVQRDLIEERLARVIEQLDHNNREIGEQELLIVRESNPKEELHERLRILQRHSDALRRKQVFLQSAYDTLDMRLKTGDRRAVPDTGEAADDEYFEAREDTSDAHDPDVKGLDSTPFADYISDFNNRFIVHNVQLKWNNSLRNIILRYIHEVSQRRGFVYYMSRKAVKFILDIVEEQGTSQYPTTNGREGTSSAEGSVPMSPMSENPDIEDRIQQLIDDAKKFVKAEDAEKSEKNEDYADPASKDIAMEFTAQNSYHLRLIAPQIQLQSEKNKNAAVLVAAKGMQLKVISIMDKERVSDSVSGLVQRRFTAAMDSLQMFVTNSKTFSTDYLHMYSGNRYGAPYGSSWPPWVPFEVMFEFELNPYGFQRVVKRTSASLRFDKYNTLRLKYNDDVTGGDKKRRSVVDSAENRMDHLWIDFPHLRAICDSAQYYSLYIIVLDLLLYSEPLEKTRNERLEKIILASDFSNLSGAPEMVVMLQERIRQLEEIKTHFQVNEKYLDRQGWRDRLAMEQDLASCEDELFFMMKAITTSQRRMDDRAKASESEGILRWYIAASEIVWHLVREGNEPLAEFQLKDASFDRTNNNDGSNNNTVEIGRVQGLNLLPNALYPEMISPFIEEEGRAFAEGREARMLRVNWLMLEPIAGIPVVNHFEVNLFPLKVQLEKEIGLKLFEYVFPKQGKKGAEHTNSSPFLVRSMLPSQEEEDEDEQSGEPSNRHVPDIPTIEEPPEDDALGAGSLELRLQPTLNLSQSRTRSTQSSAQSHRDRLHGLGLFRDSTGSSRGSIFRKHDVSTDTLTTHSTRPPSARSPSVMSSSGQPSHSNSLDGNRPNKFRLTRVNSSTASTSTSATKKETRSDDLTQMMSRASNYMTLAYVKIPSLVLCLSYKGKGQRNVEDVHNLVFRMPTLEYRNKTWSNLDLALQLKKDVTRALISHTGAIIGNKFSHHRPSKLQQSKLRQIANSSALLSSAAVQQAQDCATGQPTSGSPYSSTPANASDTSLSDPSGPPRKSFTSGRSGRGSVISQPASSYASSMHSAWVPGEHIPGEEEFQGEAVKFAEELGRVDPMEPETVRHTLSRHLTTLSQRTHNAIGEKISGLSPLGNKHDGVNGRRPSTAGHDGTEDDDSKSTRRKSKMLLGKKLLDRLPGHKD